jgi:hypothetical protein
MQAKRKQSCWISRGFPIKVTNDFQPLWSTFFPHWRLKNLGKYHHLSSNFRPFSQLWDRIIGFFPCFFLPSEPSKSLNFTGFLPITDMLEEVTTLLEPNSPAAGLMG